MGGKQFVNNVIALTMQALQYGDHHTHVTQALKAVCAE